MFEQRLPESFTRRRLAIAGACIGPLGLLSVGTAPAAEPDRTPMVDANVDSNHPSNKMVGSDILMLSNGFTSFKFDDLGGNSEYIHVYKVKGNGEVSRKRNGVYPDGEMIETAACTITARSVASVPPEVSRESDQWVRFAQESGEISAASTVYMEHPARVRRLLDEC